MSEKPFDLNALRKQIAEKEQLPVDKAEQIAELKAKIQEYESGATTHALENFMALSPEEQEAEIERISKNRNLEPGVYTLEDRKAELTKSAEDFNNILAPLRLEQWKSELAKLEAE